MLAGTYNTPGIHDYGTKTILDQVIGVYDSTGYGALWDTFKQVGRFFLTFEAFPKLPMCAGGGGGGGGQLRKRMGESCQGSLFLYVLCISTALR